MSERAENHDDEQPEHDSEKLNGRIEHIEKRLRAMEGNKLCDCADCDLTRRAVAGEPARAADALRAVEENVALRMQSCVLERRVSSLEGNLNRVSSQVDLNDIILTVVCGVLGYVIFAHTEAIVEIARRVQKLADKAA